MPPVTEIRVHGVGGATAAELLDDPDPKQVSGDGSAGFFSPRRSTGGHATEAYVWGGLTSKAFITGFWWLLLPFTLANVAGWMMRPIEQQWRKSLAKALVWVSGVGMTVVYVAYIVAIVMDVTAVRCGGDQGCVDRWWLAPLTWFGQEGVGHPVWRVTVGGGVMVLFLVLLFGVSARSRRLHETFDPQATTAAGEDTQTITPERSTDDDTLGAPNFWYQRTDRVFRIHLLAATVTVGFAIGAALWPAVDEAGWLRGSRLLWALVVGLVALSLIGFLAIPDRFVWDRDTARYAHRKNYGRWVSVWISGHIGAAVIAALSGWFWRANSPVGDAFGEQGFMQVVLVAAYAYGVLVILLIVLTAPEEGFFSRRRPHTGFRYLPVPASLGLGLFMTFAGFSALIIRVVSFLEGGNSAVLKTSLMGGNSSNFAFSAVVASLFAVWWLTRGDSADLSNAVRSDYGLAESQSPRQQRWVKRVVGARRQSEAGRNADVPLFVFLMVFSLVLMVLAVGRGPEAASSVLFGWSWLETAGSWLLVLYLFPGVFVLRAAIRARDTRRSVGKVWDVLTFWPRIYHPLAAPCYAERAVPELRDRIRQLTREGGRVILSAHSQGTVIAYAALEQARGQSDIQMQSVATVTYGSPIRQLFVPFFPAYFTPAAIRTVASGLAPGAGWANFYRDTDYIGKHVFAPATQVGKLPTGQFSHDVRLLDPEKPLLPAQRHSRYEKEPLIQQWVQKLIDDLSLEDKGPPPAEQQTRC